MADLAAKEEFILSVTEKGYGRRCSAYEFRIAGRGGQGVGNIETSPRNGPVVANFPVEEDDHLVLVTDRGQIIRVRVGDISIMSRRTQGVTVFKVAPDEAVVSVTKLSEAGANDGDGSGGGAAADAGGKSGAGGPGDGSGGGPDE